MEHEVPISCLKLFEYISPDPLDLIPASLTCSTPFPSPCMRFLRHLNSFISNDTNVGSDLEDNLFDIPKGNAIDVNWSLGTFAAYNSCLYASRVYVVDLPTQIMWTTFFDYSSDFLKHTINS